MKAFALSMDITKGELITKTWRSAVEIQKSLPLIVPYVISRQI